MKKILILGIIIVSLILLIGNTHAEADLFKPYERTQSIPINLDTLYTAGGNIKEVDAVLLPSETMTTDSLRTKFGKDVDLVIYEPIYDFNQYSGPFYWTSDSSARSFKDYYSGKKNSYMYMFEPPIIKFRPSERNMVLKQYEDLSEIYGLKETYPVKFVFKYKGNWYKTPNRNIEYNIKGELQNANIEPYFK